MIATIHNSSDSRGFVIEPFEEFGAYLSRYAAELNIKVPDGAYMTHDCFPPGELAEIQRVAKELGVIYHEDGRVSLIKQ